MQRLGLRQHLVFDNGTFVESQHQVRGWGNLDVRRQAVAPGATSVTVIVNAFWGSSESSSLYVDDFAMLKAHKNQLQVVRELSVREHRTGRRYRAAVKSNLMAQPTSWRFSLFANDKEIMNFLLR